MEVDRAAGGPRPSGPPLPEAPPATGVVIRPARPRDADGILALVRWVAAEGRWIRTEVVSWTPRELRRQLRRSWTQSDARIVAVRGRQVLGDLSLQRREHPAQRHIADLGMAVARPWRRRGVGSALLGEAFRWAAWARVEKLSLEVYEHNEAARALYRKFGFVEEGRLMGQSKKSHGYQDEIVMGRWLPT